MHTTVDFPEVKDKFWELELSNLSTVLRYWRRVVDEIRSSACLNVKPLCVSLKTSKAFQQTNIAL